VTCNVRRYDNGRVVKCDGTCRFEPAHRAKGETFEVWFGAGEDDVWSWDATCRTCEGEPCPDCSGTGEQSDIDDPRFDGPCGTCDGDACPACDGRGFDPDWLVRLPPFVGATLRHDDGMPRVLIRRVAAETGAFGDEDVWVGDGNAIIPVSQIDPDVGPWRVVVPS